MAHRWVFSGVQALATGAENGAEDVLGGMRSVGALIMGTLDQPLEFFTADIIGPHRLFGRLADGAADAVGTGVEAASRTVKTLARWGSSALDTFSDTVGIPEELEGPR